MKNKLYIVLTFALIVTTCFPGVIIANESSQKGLEIATIISKSNDGFIAEHTQGELILFDANKNRITRKFEFYAKEMPSGDKNLSRILWPLDAKGITLLSWTNLDRDNDQWLFLPAMNKIRRLNSSNQKGAFLGSEFSYEDIASHLNHVNTFKFSYLYEKEGAFNDRPCWVITRQLNQKSSRYSTHRMWIDKGYSAPVFVEYYDKKGELLKTETFSDFRKLNLEKKFFWTAFNIHMKNEQTLKESIINWNNRKIGLRLDNNLFDPNNLSEF